MNQPQMYADMHGAPHMSQGPTYSHAATAGPMSHYSQYQQQGVMPPASGHYPHAPVYGNYGYPNGVTSPQSAGPVQQQQGITLPSMMPGPNPQPYVPANATPTQGYPNAQPQATYDSTGQIAPPGMKPRVTATLWEDEGSLCFQVEAKGVCVARREDNHFINGTKLLNVAGMTRGRRDGILKSEKTRHVVKIGPMHLKGVWIPFERALDFANKEKITDLLYPLFVHNIGGLLYNPENAPRTNAVVQASERRRMDSLDSNRQGQNNQAPTLHHHHSMQGSVGGQVPPTPHSIAPHPNAARPGIDRAHTFPTPPTSASSVLGMGNQASSYEWGGQNLSNGSQPLTIDTGAMTKVQSMPTTPATTPPGNNVQSMQSYQTQQSFDGPKHYYTHTPQSSASYSQQGPYKHNSMGPPNAPASGGPDGSAHDQRTDQYSHVPSSGHPSEHGSEHHDSAYMNANSRAYEANANSYAYGPAGHHQLSPEMTSSPQQNGSGRGTPRTMPSGQPQWSQDYQTPPRVNTSGGMYNAIGDSRSSNPPSSGDNYSSSYPSAPMTSKKRGRDDDDNDRDYGSYDSKRRNTQEQFGMPLTPGPQGIKAGGGVSRQR